MSAIIDSRSSVTEGLTEGQKGILFCVLAHFFWGAMASYLKLLDAASPIEIAVHRGLWSVPIAGLVLWHFGRAAGVARVLRDPRLLLTLAFTGGLIAFNWGLYAWSIEAGRAIEASLGYYINPLMNVVMGYLFLSERFSRTQVIALAVAALGVVVQTLAAGVFPWLGMVLAMSFCLYGYIRKRANVGPAAGFFVEAMVVAIPGLVFVGWSLATGHGRFLENTGDTLLLMGLGPFTAAPLMLFGAALKRIRYSTAGLMQYISPSLVFLTAVFLFGEPMDRWRLLSFVLVWIALAIFSISALREERARRGLAAATSAAAQA